MASMKDIFPPTAIAKAMISVQAPNSFYYTGFFKTLGLAHKDPAAQVKKVFDILRKDVNGSLTIIETENFLRNFEPGARKLTPSETAAFMKAGDPNNTGKITYAGFEAMMRSLGN
ncbi:parvalbumin, thymic-like [Ranitomeya imitator]|uniref:parvalbumin, thymic-like n=1 Tax=Ranitomeya imitator TaxID=111125 RepID=UPI0037E7309E